jgi:hypothetical protein
MSGKTRKCPGKRGYVRERGTLVALGAVQFTVKLTAVSNAAVLKNIQFVS